MQVTYLLNFSLLITILALSARSYIRNIDWTDDMALFISGIDVNPQNAKLYNNVGHVYERRHQFGKAMEYYRAAADIDPEDLGAELNIARIMIEMNQTAQAESLMWSLKPKVKASSIRKRIAPHYLNLWTNLARVISTNESRLVEAEKVSETFSSWSLIIAFAYTLTRLFYWLSHKQLYHEVISIRRDFVDAYINLGELYIRRNQIAEAIDNYENALRMVQYRGSVNPTLADLYFNIGVAKSIELKQITPENYNAKLMEALMIDIAENFYRSIESNPNHKEALINLSILLQKPAFPKRKVRYYREIVLDGLLEYSGDSDVEVIEFNIAMTMLDLGGVEMRTRAVSHLEKSVEAKPDFRSALYNLALLYYDFKDFERSLHYLHDLARFHPDYLKATSLEADIYSKTERFDLAQKVSKAPFLLLTSLFSRYFIYSFILLPSSSVWLVLNCWDFHFKIVSNLPPKKTFKTSLPVCHKSSRWTKTGLWNALINEIFGRL